jgi:iron complex outermembrane receptor protein
MSPATRYRIPVVLVFLLISSIAILAASPVAALSGTVIHSSNATPVPGAAVVLEGPTTSATTVTDAAGKFSFASVPAGAYHLVVRADGFLMARIEVTLGDANPPMEVRLNADPHYTEVISVSPEARSVFDSYQPTSVLGGQDLARKLQGTIGATLGEEPGVAVRSFGPGPSRPVIRGLDGDRVLVLEDGKRMGDLSSQSGDHGVNINPAMAQKIEVVRGPATLLYGANAIGGLVNVITRSIPTAKVTSPTGSATFDLGSAAGEAGGAGDVTAGRGRVAVHVAGSGRRAGDYASPDGDVPNSFNRGGFFEGGLSFVGDHGYVGGSVGYDKTHYGIPFVEEGQTSIDPRRTTFDLRAERRDLGGVISSYRASFGVRRYKHDELDGEEVATSFINNSNEFELMAAHRPSGRLKGSFGVWALGRDFSAEGEEALSPPVDQNGFAMFVYEELTMTPHASLQFGGRYEHAGFDPGEDFANRTFDNFSASVGLLVHPTDRTTLAFNLARAGRHPALEELYFHGPHPGNNAFENGNDALESEHALGFDVAFRLQAARVSGEVTYFISNIDQFIYRQLTDEVEDDLPVTFFTQGDARLQGIESHVDVQLATPLWLEGGLDYVHGELTADSTPLPRMPPLRGRLGFRVQHNALQAGVEGVFAADQDRLYTIETGDGTVGETPTAGYSLFRLFAAYSFVQSKVTHTIAARLNNAGNTTYRNHLNYLKDLAPEPGRDFRLTWTVQF